jgi:hypothetical protein
MRTVRSTGATGRIGRPFATDRLEAAAARFAAGLTAGVFATDRAGDPATSFFTTSFFATDFGAACRVAAGALTAAFLATGLLATGCLAAACMAATALPAGARVAAFIPAALLAPGFAVVLRAVLAGGDWGARPVGRFGAGLEAGTRAPSTFGSVAARPSRGPE